MGRVFKYGDNVDTDVIIPGRYLAVSDEKELARHCMSGYDKSFVGKVKIGDVIVAGENFGCGSSREHAPLAIKANGISCVIAKSFARIFFRNSINIGLPVIECEMAAEDAKQGDMIEVNLEEGIIQNITAGKEYHLSVYPDRIMKILRAGGLKALMKKEQGREDNE